MSSAWKAEVLPLYKSRVWGLNSFPSASYINLFGGACRTHPLYLLSYPGSGYPGEGLEPSLNIRTTILNSLTSSWINLIFVSIVVLLVLTQLCYTQTFINVKRFLFFFGGNSKTRTCALSVIGRVLYQLSYISK